METGSGEYVAQVGMTYSQAKTLRDLVQAEMNRQRTLGKQDNYQHLKNVTGPLHDAASHLKRAYVARQEGRWLKEHDGMHIKAGDAN